MLLPQLRVYFATTARSLWNPPAVDGTIKLFWNPQALDGTIKLS